MYVMNATTTTKEPIAAPGQARWEKSALSLQARLNGGTIQENLEMSLLNHDFLTGGISSFFSGSITGLSLICPFSIKPASHRIRVHPCESASKMLFSASSASLWFPLVAAERLRGGLGVCALFVSHRTLPQSVQLIGRVVNHHLIQSPTLWL
jgi:hypothetical protein